ncbi:MAG: peptidase, partial [Prevotellaceae bacterium]|nr:peptidase [Prevotellaceae bacterium]
CSHPDKTLDYPNNEYGYGQIDVYRGLLYILGIDGIEEISHHQPQNVSFRVQNRSLEIDFGTSLDKDTNVRIYTTSGQMIHCETISKDCAKAVISIAQNGRGVLAVQVDGDTKQSSGSTLIRVP